MHTRISYPFVSIKKRVNILFLLVFIFSLPFNSMASPVADASVLIPITEEVTFWSDYPADELADTITDRMTNSELLAQILMFGWAGSTPSDLLIKWVSDRGLGSVKVYGWNTEDVSGVALSVNKLQRLAENRRFQIPLYTATDQEGGWIRHIKGSTSDTPGNLAIGASGYPIDAYYSGFYIASELRALGINMNFAPAVDLYTNHESSIIGPRSFGEDARNVGILGAAFCAGTMDAGVIPTAKHFPGHGATDADSHGTLPVINIDYETLENRELIPFKFLIKEQIPAIMSGHLSFPQIDTEGSPSSLSRWFMTSLLREELGFEGLIITDDMMMNGATMYAGGLSHAVRLAIQAGNDIIISSTTPDLNEAIWKSNLDLMETSDEFRSIVKKAARHVVYSKLCYFKNDTHVPIYAELSDIDKKIPNEAGTKFFLEQACRSVTLYKKGQFPYKPDETERILLAGQYQSFLDEGKKCYPQAKFIKFDTSLGPNATEWFKEHLMEMSENFDTIVIGVADNATASIAESLKDLGKRVIIISILAPVKVFNYDWADSILMVYSYSPYSFTAAFAALIGDFDPQGHLPMTVD